MYKRKEEKMLHLERILKEYMQVILFTEIQS